MGGYRLNPLLRHGLQQEQDFSFEIKDGDGNVIDIVASFDKVREDLGKKVDKEQGVENRNKVLVTDTNGKVALSSNLLMTSAERAKLAKITEDKFITTEERDKLARISNVLIFKNVLPRESDLTNISQKTVGDVYYVTNSEADGSISYKQYVWTGDRWAVLGTSQSIKVTELQAGDHIRIQDDFVSAHSFVPEYDSVSKVLPHEKIFHYIGETTDKFTHGYIYERKLVSKPVTETQSIFVPAGTKYLEIVEDGFKAPKGTYYLMPSFVLVQQLIEKYGENIYFLLSHEPRASDSGHAYVTGGRPELAQIGDRVMDNTTGEDDITITNIETTSWGSRHYYLSNGDKITDWRGAGGSRGLITAFVNQTGDIVYWSSAMSVYLATESRYSSEGLDAYIELYNRYPQEGYEWRMYDSGTEKGQYIDVTYTHGEEVWEWVQLNVQPSSTPYDPTELENRIEELETKSHQQNTDTMLASGKLKVESNKVSATLPIVSSGDIQGSDTSGTIHLLSKKMDSEMLRTYNSFADLVADTQRPAGCWCAIIE